MNKIPLPLKGLVLLILTMWLLSACHTTKQMQSTSFTSFKTIHDTNSTDTNRLVLRVDSSSHERIVKDTAVGIAGNEILYLLEESTPDTTITEGNLSLRINTDKKGNRRIECKADSLTIVIKNITYERDFFKRGFDSIATVTAFSSRDMDSSATTLKEVTDVERLGFWERVKELLYGLLKYLIAAVIGIVIGWILSRKFRYI